MRIESIEIINYKSFGNEFSAQINLSDIVVITGANDSGKTSILEASYVGMRQIMENPQRGVKKAITVYDDSKHHIGFKPNDGEQVAKFYIKCTTQESNGIFKVMVKDGSLETQLRKLSEKGFDVMQSQVENFLSNANIVLKVPLNEVDSLFSSFSDFIDKESWMDQVDKFFDFNGVSVEEFAFYLSRVVSEITRFHRSIQSMTCLYMPSSTREIMYSEEESETSLKDRHDPGLELINFFKSISSESGRRSGNYSSYLSYCKIILPELVKIELIDHHYKGRNEDLFLTWIKNGKERSQPLSRSGSGIFNVLFLISKFIISRSGNNIVLIDEPETGLHPILQQRFMKILRKLASVNSIQWIISTHSPFILQSLKSTEKLYLIEHDGIQSKSREIEITNKHEVFNALGAYLPLTFSSNGVIFVEGQTEVVVLSVLLQKAGLDIEQEKILIIPLGGENIFKIDPKDIKKLHENSMVIIDSDLSKTVESGGTIKKVKTEYGLKCNENAVGFVMLKQYRTLENMYPPELLAEVIGKNVEDLTYSNYDEIIEIPPSKKVNIGECVAKEFSCDQAKEFPLVKEIVMWWEGMGNRV